MSRHAGVSPSTVQRIWSKNDLKPHRLKTFKLSNHLKFEEKFWDVIGLYLYPPTKALVLCCDEKSQCQALERTQLGLPLAPKRARTMTHDYTRHGTVTLFRAGLFGFGRPSLSLWPNSTSLSPILMRSDTDDLRISSSSGIKVSTNP